MLTLAPKSSAMWCFSDCESVGMELKASIGSFTLEVRSLFGLSDMYGNFKANPFGRSVNISITIKLTCLVESFK